MKKNVILLIKGICILMPLIFVSVYSWRNPLGFMDDEAPYYLWNKEKTNTVQDKYYETIILGDSVANAAYIPELLSDHTINLAMGGTTPVENYYVLQDWLKNNRAPKTCYISFMDFHLQMEDCFWKRTMHFHRFRTKQNLEILREAAKYQETSIVTEKYMEDFISYELYLPNKYITSLMNAGFNQRYEENAAMQQMDDLHRGRYIAAKSTVEFTSTDTFVTSEFYVNPLFDKYYRKLIELCIENGIQVYIIKLPVSDNFVFEKEYISDFQIYYGNLMKRYPKLMVVRFPVYEKKYFVDGTHMNMHGALRFSKEVKELYPEEFEEERLSAAQVAGINDYIMQETQIDQIVKWIDGKDYTIILNDGTGKFESVYGEMLEKDFVKLHMLRSDERLGGCTYISGKNKENAGFSIQTCTEGLQLKINDEQYKVYDYPDTDTLNIFVLDNYNKNFLCEKTFKYTDENFLLLD